MESMPGLIYFRLYYDNIDLMAELDTNRVKELDWACMERRKIVYGLAKTMKEGKVGKRTLKHMFKTMLI